MKRIAKILSVVLVLSLLASIMAIPASAAVENGATGFKLTFKDTDGTIVNSVAAGEVVDLYVSVMCNSPAFSWQIMVKYNTEYLSHTRKAATAAQTPGAKNGFEAQGIFADDSSIEDEDDPIWQWEAESAGNGYYLMPGAAATQSTPHTDAMYPSSWTDADKATYKCINATYKTDTTDSILLVNTKGEYEEWIRFRFYANKDTVLDETMVDLIKDDSTKLVFNLCNDSSYILSNDYGVGQVSATSISVTRAESAVSHDVYKLAESKKHATGESFTTASFFAFKGIDPKFDAANKSEHIESITATITANGNPVAAEDIPVIRFVYDLGEGEYGFRVILKNVAADAEISITPVLNTDDGTTYSAETITFNVADVEAV